MLCEYQLDWIKIVDFLLIAKFLASTNNFGTPSTYLNNQNMKKKFQASEMKRNKNFSLKRSLIVNEEKDYQSESSILELRFKIKPHHVRRGSIEVRCEAEIMNGYNRKSKLAEIFVKTHNNAENLATHHNRNYEYSSHGVALSTKSAKYQSFSYVMFIASLHHLFLKIRISSIITGFSMKKHM